MEGAHLIGQYRFQHEGLHRVRDMAHRSAGTCGQHREHQRHADEKRAQAEAVSHCYSLNIRNAATTINPNAA